MHLFCSYLSVIQDKLCNFIKEFLSTKSILAGVNHSFIVLIPKIDNPFNFYYFRPMKIIISLNQDAFVKGRWIAKNLMVAHEVVHKIKHHKEKNGFMLFKFNLNKTYDELEWQFIDKVLVAWGFNEDFR